MSAKNLNHTINYIEFKTNDVARAKKFYSAAFGWSFVDYGPDYASFSAETAAVNGGFMKADSAATSSESGPLIVLYSADLGKTQAEIIAAGGTITVPTFEFPGGRRFHFSDGAGNTLAVWSE